MGAPFEDPPLVENTYCVDIYATDVSRVENLGSGLVRIVWEAEQRDGDGHPQRVIVARMIRTAASIFKAQRKVEAALIAMGFLPDEKLVS